MIRLSRVHLHESVSVSGLTGEKNHLTADVDNVVLTLDDRILRIVVPGHAIETLVPIDNIRWLWAVPHRAIVPPRAEEKRADTQDDRPKKSDKKAK